LYLNPTEKHWIIDIEADGFDATRVWILVARNAITKEQHICEDYESIREFFSKTAGCYYVGHNLIAFDIPVLNRLVGTRIPSGVLVDTFLLSSLYSPSLSGGHSLDAWGHRVDVKKPKHEEWDKYSEAMKQRCISDVEINWRTFHALTKRMRTVGFTETGCEIEHKAWRIIQKQRKNGFYINLPQAHELYATLREKERELKEKIHERFPPSLEVLATYKKARKASGEPTKDFERHLEQYEKLEFNPDGSYRAFGYVHFSLGSPKQRSEKLQALGWVPREFTKPSPSFPNGQPKTTDNGDLVPSLREFAEESGIEEVKLIADWIAVNARANMLNNWMGLVDERTSCVHGGLWLASTLRYRHDKPNTANIPSVRTRDIKDGEGNKIGEEILRGDEGQYTYEARDVWQTRDRNKRRLVGVDAKGIQLRVLAHYLNNPTFTNAILSQDPHQANAEAMGLPGRRIAKTITYATCMGAGDARIASESGLPLPEAKAAKKVFFNQVPELNDLIRKLKRDVKQTGRIVLCDGTPILVPLDYMVIPYLLQGDESRIMRKAMILVDEEVRKGGLDVLKCGDIHDEWQSDVFQGHVDQFIEICKRCFERAGRSFNYNLPIECDAKVGLTWAETH
jgi:DNA polymerase-1